MPSLFYAFKEGRKIIRVIRETGFEKDLKKLRKNRQDFSKFYETVGILSLGEKLEKSMKNHKLKANWKNHWECHIDNDWILIYQIVKNSVVLVRTGKHSNLFRNTVKI
ncbi:MAG: type II toxin-antitoxin system YafQ family toxin [Fastidiosipilaceae bacterium]|jgi:mRNA interferase YafQ